MMTGSIYVDFDDVLCETARILTDIVAERFGKHTRFEDIYSFDLSASFGLSASEQQVLIELFHDADILSSIPPVDGAAEAFCTWAEAGCTVHVVTGRPPETRDASRAWLARHGFPYADITFVDKYGRGHGKVPGTRQMTLAELETCDFALAVDDSPDMVRFLATRTQVPVVVFDRPWNVDLAHMSSVVRCCCWSELMELFPQPGRG